MKCGSYIDDMHGYAGDNHESHTDDADDDDEDPPPLSKPALRDKSATHHGITTADRSTNERPARRPPTNDSTEP